MATRLLPFCHVRSPEVLLGGERVMGATMKRQVLGSVRALFAESAPMVELKVMGFLAAFTTLVDIRATRTVALEDGSAHSRRDVPAFPVFSRRYRSLAGAFTARP